MHFKDIGLDIVRIENPFMIHLYITIYKCKIIFILKFHHFTRVPPECFAQQLFHISRENQLLASNIQARNTGTKFAEYW